MENIILIGMPGAGKSTVGVILAKVLGYEFLDSDLLIQKTEGRLLSQIIEQEGTTGFKEIEGRVNASIKVDRTVIATGGSAVYHRTAMEHLKSIGKVIYLKVPYSVLCRRLQDLKGRGVVLEEGQTLEDLFAEREPLYEAYADFTVCQEGKDIEASLAAIMELLNMQ